MQRNGTLQASPVGFTFNSELDTIDIYGYNMASQKYRNIAEQATDTEPHQLEADSRDV